MMHAKHIKMMMLMTGIIHVGDVLVEMMMTIRKSIILISILW